MLGKKQKTTKKSEHSHIICHLKGLSLLIIFYWKTMIWKWSRKEIFDISLTLWYEKIWSKEPLHCIYDFIIIHRSSLRTVETKPVSFYMLHNLLYEKNSGRCKETFESTCKKHFFYGILRKHAQKNAMLTPVLYHIALYFRFM